MLAFITIYGIIGNVPIKDDIKNEDIHNLREGMPANPGGYGGHKDEDYQEKRSGSNL